MPPTKLRGQLLIAVRRKSDATAAARDIERLRLRVEKDDVELVHAFERLQAFQQLLLRSGERAAFHAGRAIEHVNELAAFALNAEHAGLAIAARAAMSRELRSADRWLCRSAWFASVESSPDCVDVPDVRLRRLCRRLLFGCRRFVGFDRRGREQQRRRRLLHDRRRLLNDRPIVLTERARRYWCDEARAPSSRTGHQPRRAENGWIATHNATIIAA